MVVAMMVTRGGKCRGGKHHQEQGSSENLFHATNVARPPQREKWIQCRASREARGGGNQCQHGTTATLFRGLANPIDPANSLTCRPPVYRGLTRCICSPTPPVPFP
jgi:hypothetical protein